MAIYKLSYDEVVDSDIHGFLNRLPRSKKAEVVRHAIRLYINELETNEVAIKMPKGMSGMHATPIQVVAQTPVIQTQAEIQQEIRAKKPKVGLKGK